MSTTCWASHGDVYNNIFVVLDPNLISPVFAYKFINIAYFPLHYPKNLDRLMHVKLSKSTSPCHILTCFFTTHSCCFKISSSLAVGLSMVIDKLYLSNGSLSTLVSAPSYLN